MCRQEKTGSCDNCPVIDAGAAVVRRDRLPVTAVYNRIALLCPDERDPQLAALVRQTTTLTQQSTELKKSKRTQDL